MKDNNRLWSTQKNPIIVVVMPAYNAEKTVKQTFNDLPKDLISEVILVDDASKDKTAEKARKLGITVYLHKKNKGYGGNQKTCYDQALKRSPDVVVMVHPDYQYDAKLVGVLCEPIINGRVDIMLGSRIQTRKQVLAQGMPIWKYFANRVLTLIENLALGLNLSEYHTGYRAFSSNLLKTIPYNKFSDDFIFDQEILLSSYYFGFNIGDIPVPCRYFPEASSINFQRSLKYGLSIILLIVLYYLNLTGIIKNKIFTRPRR